MYFTQTAEYALRAMVYVASLKEGESIRSADLSEKTGIPSHYLSKIMRRMVVDGLVHSQKGHRGGFRLSRPPTAIRFLDILVASGYNPEPDRCAFGWGECDAVNPCPLHPVWSELNNSFLDWAGRTTLETVHWERDALERLLSMRSLQDAKAKMSDG